MSSYLPAHALAFRDLFALGEHALRRCGYVRANRPKAEIDWQKFANELGEPFFSEVVKSGMAVTLIGEPPRALHRNGEWLPKNQSPISNVVELILRGVCQVRHNIEHGEKYVEPEGARSDALVNEAHWVLERAIETLPALRAAFAKI
jgi:hypothetical protein